MKTQILALCRRERKKNVMSKKDVYALSSVSIMSFVIPSKAFTMLYRCDLKYWKAFPPIRELSSELCYNILQMVSIRVTSASQPGEESRTLLP